MLRRLSLYDDSGFKATSRLEFYVGDQGELLNALKNKNESCAAKKTSFYLNIFIKPEFFCASTSHPGLNALLPKGQNALLPRGQRALVPKNENLDISSSKTQ